jgi:hypothetical protein
MICLPEEYEQWVVALTSQAFITFIVGAAAVTVSSITYSFQKKQLKLKSLMDVFKVLNLPDHREARKVTYGLKTHASCDILKLTRPEADPKLEGEIEKVSSDMVKGDMNNAATLIYHGLMDKSIFLEEYWWIVLRTWDSVKDTVSQRRTSRTGALSYMRNLRRLNAEAEEYAKEHFNEDFEEYERKYRPKIQKQEE